jgi:hypothetical protein
MSYTESLFPIFPLPLMGRGRGEGKYSSLQSEKAEFRVNRAGLRNQNAVRMDGIRGALWLPAYLRRDATALGFILLSMLDITSSFL